MTPPDAAAVAALPVVGAALGALAGLTGWAASRIAPQPIAGALALGTFVVLTGAVHLDGFLDGCDALFASVPPSRRLEILKDPHHGTFAGAGLLVVGSVAYASCTTLPPRRLPAVLAFAAALARTTIAACALRYPDVRARHRPAFDSPNAGFVLAAFGALLGVAALRMSRGAIVSIPAAIALGLASEAWCAKRLGGGLVGDAYGFGIVLLEVTILATLAARDA